MKYKYGGYIYFVAELNLHSTSTLAARRKAYNLYRNKGLSGIKFHTHKCWNESFLHAGTKDYYGVAFDAEFKLNFLIEAKNRDEADKIRVEKTEKLWKSLSNGEGIADIENVHMIQMEHWFELTY